MYIYNWSFSSSLLFWAFIIILQRFWIILLIISTIHCQCLVQAPCKLPIMIKKSIHHFWEGSVIFPLLDMPYDVMNDNKWSPRACLSSLVCTVDKLRGTDRWEIQCLFLEKSAHKICTQIYKDFTMNIITTAPWFLINDLIFSIFFMYSEIKM